MHGNELYVILVGVTHLCKNLPKTCELNLIRVNIVLVDFISNNDDLVFKANFDDLFNIVPPKNLSSGIARVDHYHCSEVDTQVLGIFNSLHNVIRINTPILLFIKIVFDHSASV